jgi:hypothetical protein
MHCKTKARQLSSGAPRDPPSSRRTQAPKKHFRVPPRRLERRAPTDAERRGLVRTGSRPLRFITTSPAKWRPSFASLGGSPTPTSLRSLPPEWHGFLGDQKKNCRKRHSELSTTEPIGTSPECSTSATRWSGHACEVPRAQAQHAELVLGAPGVSCVDRAHFGARERCLALACPPNRGIANQAAFVAISVFRPRTPPFHGTPSREDTRSMSNRRARCQSR